MRNYQLIFMLSLGLIFSFCENNPDKEKNIVQSEDEANISENSIIEDEPSFAKIELLIPGSYRKSDGYPSVKNKDWMMLDNENGKWRISQSKINVSYGEDDCSGDQVMIISSDNENAVLFFTSFKEFNPNSEILMSDLNLLPGNEVNIQLSDNRFQLVPKGEILNYDANEQNWSNKIMKDSEGNPYADKIKNYSLVFINSDGKETEIFKTKEFDDSVPKIISAADLNNDGIPDFFIDLSTDYEESYYYLFLSDSKNQKQPMKIAAKIRRNFDC